jgi:hypothetical protein
MGELSTWHWVLIITLWHSILFVIMAVLAIWPIWRIVGRAGYRGAWSPLLFVPIVNIILLYVFAFARWPALADRRERITTFDIP